jgi:hypothetical protein
VGETNKGEKDMKATTNMTTLKRALVLAAVLTLTGTAWAKPKSAPPGVSGDLSSDRTIATVTISDQQCSPVASDPTASETLSVYIFQSVGRLINIGIGNGTDADAVPCDGTPYDRTIDVYAIQGLSFQPGPATMLIRVTAPDPLDATKTIVSEKGFQVNLHP